MLAMAAAKLERSVEEAEEVEVEPLLVRICQRHFSLRARPVMHDHLLMELAEEVAPEVVVQTLPSQVEAVELKLEEAAERRVVTETPTWVVEAPREELKAPVPMACVLLEVA